MRILRHRCAHLHSQQHAEQTAANIQFDTIVDMNTDGNIKSLDVFHVLVLIRLPSPSPLRSKYEPEGRVVAIQ